MNFSTELPDKNISGPNNLTTVFFYASALGITVSAVFRAAARFFMCHNNTSLLV
jgi:hypothetical protein